MLFSHHVLIVYRESNRKRCMLYLNPAQQSSLTTIPPLPVMKQASSPSTTNYILKTKVLMFGGDMNAQISKDGNMKFCLYNLRKRNGEY